MSDESNTQNAGAQASLSFWTRLANRAAPGTPGPGHWLTRFVILRWLGFVYLIGFAVAANQLVPLIGEHGLLPARIFMDQVATHFGSRSAAFLELPSVFWFGVSDWMLRAVSWTGIILSLAVLLGYANAIVMAALWGLYMSIIHIGQDWYSYGWEIQLLETGFLAIFLCPLLDGRPFSRRQPPVLVIWLFRWLILRIMLGAGLIKLRGDACWRDLTCLYYYYETQPIPNPLSRWFHFRPHGFQQFSVLWNHFIELIAPWSVFGPRLVRHIGGVLLLSFQFILILSGNLSFLNWLTIVPILACFDDSLLRRVLPRMCVMGASKAAESARVSPAQNIAAAALAILVACLSLQPVGNLFSPSQIMNTSFNRWHLVNTYGAFGRVGTERREVIFEGTSDPIITSMTQWREYQFKGQPGDLRRRPSQIAPYQLRLDWQMWFAAMSGPEDYPWTLNFVWKLLHNDAGALSLLASNPFPEKPPRHVRAVLYNYQFAPPGNPTGAWWKRAELGQWLPPLSAEDPRLKQWLEAHGW